MTQHQEEANGNPTIDGPGAPGVMLTCERDACKILKDNTTTNGEDIGEWSVLMIQDLREGNQQNSQKMEPRI